MKPLRWAILAAIFALALYGCSPMPSAVSESFIQSLAKDPATACVAVGPIAPYFGGLFYARVVPNVAGNMQVDCGIAKINPPNGLGSIPAGAIITIPTPK